MHIKRFEASTMAEALSQVKAELGSDALILSSRTIRRGGRAFGLLSRDVVEVQAAIERSGEEMRPAHGNPASGADWSQRTFGADRQARERFEVEIRNELRALRRAVDEISSTRLAVDCGSEDETILARLEACGLEAVHARGLASEWSTRRAEGAPAAIEELLAARLELRCTPPRSREEGGVRILIGAPGVGKTTTLAKLAGRNEEGERDVALVSLDHYRIGAADSLRRYATLLESPFVEASRAGELRAVRERYAGFEVLVDTAGRGRRGEERLADLRELREALGVSAQVELVVDATARPEVHREQLARFRHVEPDRLIVTKTDECEDLTALANLMLDPSCPPVCWRGTGQRVPEDLEEVEARHIAREVLELAA